MSDWQSQVLSELRAIRASLQALADNSATPRRPQITAALAALKYRGDLRDGLTHAQVHDLVLRELGLSTSNPPFGFRSTETIRRALWQMRKADNGKIQ